MKFNYKIIISILIITWFVLGILFLPTTSQASRTIQNSDGTVTTVDEEGDNGSNIQNNETTDDKNNTNNNINNNDTANNEPVKNDSTESKNTNTNKENKYAPPGAQITQIYVKYMPDMRSYNLTIHTNMLVYSGSLIIAPHLINQNDLDELKEKGISIFRDKEDWMSSMANIDYGEEKKDNFYVNISPEKNPNTPDAIGRIIVFGVYTTEGANLYNPYYFVVDTGEYKQLPIPPLEEMYKGKNYLEVTGTCNPQKESFFCGIVKSFIREDTSFNSNFAKKYPLLYISFILFISLLVIIIYILILISYFLTFIFQKNPWGIIFDSTTLKPVEGAIARIFDKERNKLLETKVTGKDGRFTFLPGKGNFYLQITKPGYVFPSKIISSTYHPMYYHLYHGEEILIKTDGAIFLTNIPLDPQNSSSSIIEPFFVKKIALKIARARWGLIIALMAIYLLIYIASNIGENNMSVIPMEWSLVSLIPILILELYFWSKGRKVKILKTK